jgi:5S rRNA maturation endonuclease (ribonuclease M5)
MAKELGSYSKYILKCLKELSKTRKVKIGTRQAKIQCPNPLHKGGREEHESLLINITKNGTFYPGSAKCYVCDIFFKNWEEVANALKRPDLISKKAVEEADEKLETFFNNEIEKQVMGEDEVKLDKVIGPSISWDETKSWRTVNGKLLTKIGARLYKNKFGQPMLYLPCMVHGSHIGGIRANIKKKGKSNYFNTKGIWTKNLGLFPYDYIIKMLIEKDLETVVLVEGSRDALKSIQFEIPALAILGINNWTDIKANLVLSLPIKRVITAFDSDEYGDKAKNSVYASLKNDLQVMNFSFAKEMKHLGKKKLQELGLEDGIDPGSMTPEIAKKLRKFVTAEW